MSTFRLFYPSPGECGGYPSFRRSWLCVFSFRERVGGRQEQIWFQHSICICRNYLRESRLPGSSWVDGIVEKKCPLVSDPDKLATKFQRSPPWTHNQFLQPLKVSWKVSTRRLPPCAAGRPQSAATSQLTEKKAGGCQQLRANGSVLE